MNRKAAKASGAVEPDDLVNELSAQVVDAALALLITFNVRTLRQGIRRVVLGR